MSKVICYKCDVCGKILQGRPVQYGYDADNTFTEIDPPKSWWSRLRHPNLSLFTQPTYDICSDCLQSIKELSKK